MRKDDMVAYGQKATENHERSNRLIAEAQREISQGKVAPTPPRGRWHKRLTIEEEKCLDEILNRKTDVVAEFE